MLTSRTTGAISKFLEGLNAASQQTGIYLDVETGVLSTKDEATKFGYLVNPVPQIEGTDTAWSGYRFTDSGRDED